MLQSFTIKNFRCFKDLTIEPLERVNLIAGKNNVGKTALLEALYLNLAPDLLEWPPRIHLLRGFEKLGLDVDTKWGWLFFGKRTDEIVQLISMDEKDECRSLKIGWEKAGATSIQPDRLTEPMKNPVGPRELLFEFQNSTDKGITVRVFQGNPSRFPITASVSVGVLLGNRTRSPEEDAKRFSELELVGRQDEVLNALRVLDPRLDRLAVLYFDVPMIYGDIGVGPLVPLPQMGDGMLRVLAIVLEIAKAAHGVVLIDEVENGLHYSVMTKVWTAIAEAARRSDTQIFAATHSWECIRAAHHAFVESGTYDFRLHRLDRIHDEIRVVTYDQGMLATALATGLEVR